MHLTDAKITAAAEIQTLATRRYVTSFHREILPTIKLTWSLFTILREQKNIGHLKPVSALTITISGLSREGTQEISRIWELGK